LAFSLFIKISVIIPVYNCETTIVPCIASVQRQTCRELEIICVDDGSTDASTERIQALCEKDARIRLFRQTNQGAGCARNLGLLNACGEFVAFLDADDYYLDVEALQTMYDACKFHSVEICGSLRKKLQSGKLKEASEQSILRSGAMPESVLLYRDFQMDYDYQSYLFDRKRLIERAIFFSNYRRYQDPPFFVKAMYAAAEFIYVGKYLYCYRVPNNAKKIDAGKVADLLRGLLDNMQFALKYRLTILMDKTMERLEYEYASLIVHNMTGNDICIRELLQRANELAVRYKLDASYRIRPFRLLEDIGSVGNHRGHLARMLAVSESLSIYGAGMMGQAFFNYLKANSMQAKVKNFIVTSAEDDLKMVCEIPVISLEQYLSYAPQKRTQILVAVDGCYQKEIEDYLLENHITQYELLDPAFLLELVSE